MSERLKIKLGDISNLISRGISPKYVKSGTTVLNQKCIRSFSIDYSFSRLTAIDTKYNPNRVLRNNDILINSTGTGTLGRVSLFKEQEEKVLADSHITIVRTNNKVSPEYLANYLLMSEENLIGLGRGATNQQELNKSDLVRFPVMLPNLETQSKIANVLSTYDKLIENNNCRIEILEQIAEEIYKEWFVRMRFPGYENTKFVKGIPEGWEVKSVEELAEFKRGKNLVIADAIPGEVPVIAGGMAPSCYHNQANTQAPVITVSASGANAGYTQLNHVDVWASDCSYIDKKETDIIYYIYLLLKTSHKEILNLQLGSAQPHVYARDLNKFKFLKPTQDLILKMNNIAKDVFNQVKHLTKKNQNLIKQRNLLLPRLMNGTIEVK